jgi:hypothetical protein
VLVRVRRHLVTPALAGALLVAAGAAVVPSPQAATVRLTAPAAVRAQAAGPAVVLTWRDRARGERRYEVRTSPVTRTRRLGAGVRRVRLTGLLAGRGYTARVRACGGRPLRCGRSASVRFTAPRSAPAPAPGAAPAVGGCHVFPAANVWNRDVSAEPVDPRSDAYLRSIGLDDTLHADFGSGRYGDYGIPFSVVPATQPRVPIRFTAYGDESDPGPYPVPPGARVEGGDGSDGDRHVLVVREGECKLYELYRAFRREGGWDAESGAVYDLRDPRDRPAGWTSADAAGLPILPGLARADEASAGAIRHALRFTVSRSQAGYVAPARHFASSRTDPDLPPMGLRLRLKASFDRGAFRGQARAILDALATYGMIVADNGSDWFISGTPDPAWDDDDLDQLKTVPGRAFEVVRSGPIVTRRP